MTRKKDLNNTIFFFFVETESCCIVQAGLELMSSLFLDIFVLWLVEYMQNLQCGRRTKMYSRSPASKWQSQI
jgi:hypothetical protein